MISLHVPLEYVQLYLLVFARISALVFAAPVFGSGGVPPFLKAGLCVALTAACAPALGTGSIPALVGWGSLAMAVLCEVLIGLICGFSVKVLFASIQLAGQLVGFQMGFAIANVVDPLSGDQMSIVAEFMNVFSVLVFLSINAHLWLLSAVLESFRVMPLFSCIVNDTMGGHIVNLGAQMFIVSVKIGAPVIAALLLTTVAFGLVARTVPQMQVFIVAMPAKILIGLVILGVSLPYVVSFLRSLCGESMTTMAHLLKAL